MNNRRKYNPFQTPFRRFASPMHITFASKQVLYLLDVLSLKVLGNEEKATKPATVLLRKIIVRKLESIGVGSTA
jgi:hypothetical protein